MLNSLDVSQSTKNIGAAAGELEQQEFNITPQVVQLQPVNDYSIKKSDSGAENWGMLFIFRDL